MASDSHLLLRYAESYEGLDDTISEHQAVLGAHGEVWFGKLGRAFGQRTIELLTQQIADDHPTFLFLAARRGRHEFVLHKARMQRATLHVPEDRGLVPGYYARAGITSRVGTWFGLSSMARINPASLKALVVASTGTPILSVLGPSRNSMFIVVVKDGAKV
jgi:hypothetical protein